MVVLLLVFVAGRCLVPMDETDLFFNLRLGEIVLAGRHVPTENLLSFTFPSATDINLAWLFQILLALAHRAGGIPGTVLLKTALVVATWLLLYRAALRRGAHPAPAAFFLALAAWAAEPRFVERPHLVTFLGLAFTLLAIERAEKGQPRLLWLLVPLGLLWANGNSCFFLAPSLLALYALGARLDRQPGLTKRALWIAAALVPLMFATPSGFRCLVYIANHFRMPTLRPLQEYRHAEWPLDGPYFFLVAGLVLAAMLPRFSRKLPELAPCRVLLPALVLAVLGGLRIRFVAEFAMLAGPALAVAATRIAPWLADLWPKVTVACALLVLTAIPRVSAAAAGGRVFDLQVEADLLPLSAIDFAERNGLRHRMYNDLEVGSYLTWRGWPHYQVFQDPRINGYPESFHAILRRADLPRPEFQALLDRFGVTSALVTYPTLNPRGALFDPKRWALVYRGSDGLVFVRRDQETPLSELPLTFTYSAASGLQPVPMATPPEGTGASLCEWKRQLGDYYRSQGQTVAAREAYQAALSAHGETAAACQQASRSAAGSVALQAGDFAEAERLLAGIPTATARANHGFALLGLSQPADALADFDGVLAADANNDEATFGRGVSLAALGRAREADTAFGALLARSPNHVSAPAARRERARLHNALEKR